MAMGEARRDLKGPACVVLDGVGLVLLSAAAWLVHPGFGLAVGGLACMASSWRIGRDVNEKEEQK